MSLSNIRIVLVRTFHPGNIGSAARSMKTMGLSDLCVVAPREFPSPEAEKMAAGGADLLAAARQMETLDEAVADCSVVVASTARVRGYDLPKLSPAEAARKLVQQARSGPVALLFGPERMGLHNQDMQLARYRVSIPANPAYNSLNMAAAVQTLSYEIYQQSLNPDSAAIASANPDTYPTQHHFEMLMSHLGETLADIGFLRRHEGETMQRLRHLLTRAQITEQDYNILRGILRAVQRNLADSQTSDNTRTADKKKSGHSDE